MHDNLNLGHAIIILGQATINMLLLTIIPGLNVVVLASDIGRIPDMFLFLFRPPSHHKVTILPLGLPSMSQTYMIRQIMLMSVRLLRFVVFYQMFMWLEIGMLVAKITVLCVLSM